MSRDRLTPVEASRRLAAAGGVAARLLEQHGPCQLGRRPPVHDRFKRLARSVTFQQLSGAAAATIWDRVETTLGGDVTPESVLSSDDGALREAGLSAAKSTALAELSRAVLDGTIDLRRLGRMPDDAVVHQLTALRGIGPWTAQMFLIFSLHRLDVWPVGDAGVRNGWAAIHGLGRPPNPDDLALAGSPYQPYRTVMAWWCWRSADRATP